MNTHYVNQELATHHYATLRREAESHRLASEIEAETEPTQITWFAKAARLAGSSALNRRAFGLAIRSI